MILPGCITDSGGAVSHDPIQTDEDLEDTAANFYAFRVLEAVGVSHSLVFSNSFHSWGGIGEYYGFGPVDYAIQAWVRNLLLIDSALGIEVTIFKPKIEEFWGFCFDIPVK
ncbi:hypothetical protein TNIN_302491 [Trichonephila inaurata madagascariensis]|uniref:Uncharacterized protein n=1 Tax=Trichonephila inaurata madagascariensis TaxID=2747483 RepID=A0A8X7CU25_9ARAC|nr:hypothetical protein TNIN_302491 [Trichonephila inaurata madagascariensis]